MSSTHGIRMKKPVHPGGFVKHETIEALGLTVTAAAHALGGDPGSLVHLSERAGPPVAGDGLADREGVRCVDGHPHEDAKQL